MEKKEYLFIIHGEMTPFQRATLAKFLWKKAVQLKCGLSIKSPKQGELTELTYSERMDKKNHPKE